MDNIKKMVVVAAAHLSRFFFSILEQEVMDSSSDSSEDEHESTLLNTLSFNTGPREREIPRCENYYEITIPRYLPEEFQSNFRMTPDAFRALCRHVLPHLKEHPEKGRSLVNPEKKLLAIIWLLATPDSFRSVGHQFNLGKASIADYFVRVIKVLNNIAPMVIKWPNEDNKVQIMRQFYNFGGIDRVIGAVDGTYVPIKAPTENAHVYVTRKHNYAMTLQCIAEPSLKFTDCYMAYPGSVSDTRIFRNSHIYQAITENHERFFDGNFILGDKAYPLLNWCIPPYIERRRLTAPQRYFNTMHAKTRQVVERSFALLFGRFALLFGRFRRLKYLDMNRVDLIPAAVIATCVLHNICLNHADLLIEEYIREGNEFIQENNGNNEMEDMAFANNVARIQRDNICLRLYNRRRNVL